MKTFLRRMEENPDGWKQQLLPVKGGKRVELSRGFGKKMIKERWKKIMGSNRKYKEYLKRKRKDPFLNQPDKYGFYEKNPQEELMDSRSFQRSEVYRDNIENFVGTVKVPLGIAGPLRVNGFHAQGEYFIPLATTEAALVASISRGISGINHSGGATAAVLMEGVDRDPVFHFRSVIQVFEFVQWSTGQFENYKKVASRMTRFGKLVDVKYLIDGCDVHVKFVYTSGDASGQNMVTICTEEVLEYINHNTPVKAELSLIEGGLSGDKKATAAVLNYVRGKKVVAECVMKRDVAQTVFHASPEDMVEVGLTCIGSYFWMGTIGVGQHYSNAITALSIALGQDPACAAESHVGVGRISVTKERDLYCCVTLPNLLVGTVGGGTKLPSQRACLEIMGLYGPGKANALAEVYASVCLAGEMSLGAAITTGDFAKSHKILRGDREPIDFSKDSLDEAFLKAQGLLVKLSEIPPKRLVLEIYSLYKQSTIGDCNIDAPSVFSSIKIKAKYESWKKKVGMNPKVAKKEYIDLVVKLSEEDEEKVLDQKKKYQNKK